ncbi:MAG: hypothetical protein P8X82_15905, partial [Gemmatimonadales bacterium]
MLVKPPLAGQAADERGNGEQGAGSGEQGAGPSPPTRNKRKGWVVISRLSSPVSRFLRTADRGRENRLVSAPPPSEPDVRISRIRLS